MPCFDDCGCYCENFSTLGDDLLLKETRFETSIYSLTHANVGWFMSNSECSTPLIKSWELSRRVGIYILWHKDNYCALHDRFHMRALYVGKGYIEKRLFEHWKAKDFSNEMLVYWTFVEMTNRQAKYYEQLLLDIYDLPLNRSENPGVEKLCAHFTQEEVD